MKKKIVYEGYCEATEIEEMKKCWYSPVINVARVPSLHRLKGRKQQWGDGKSGKKVRITVEEI